MHGLRLVRLELEIQFRQTIGRPALRRAVAGRFADEHDTALAKKWRSALGGDCRRSEAAGDHRIHRVAQRTLPARLLGPAVPDHNTFIEAEQPPSLGEERHTACVSLDEVPHRVGPHGSGQDKSRDATTGTQIDCVLRRVDQGPRHTDGMPYLVDDGHWTEKALFSPAHEAGDQLDVVFCRRWLRRRRPHP